LKSISPGVTETLEENKGRLLVVLIFGHRGDAAEKMSEIRRGFKLVLGSVIKNDVGSALRHVVDDLDVCHALLPIPAQVMIVEHELAFARMAVAGRDPRG